MQGSRRRARSTRSTRRASMSPYLDTMSACSTVAAHRRCVDEFIRGVKGMLASKAFRAMLELRDHEVHILQMWAARHCALHVCFHSDRGTIVLVALRSQPQSSASFARTIRNALRRRGVSTTGLRGHWLCIITEREAVSVCLGTAELALTPHRADEQRCNHPRTSWAADDERVVELLR